MMTTVFQTKFSEAEEYYKNGEYYEAIQVCKFALTCVGNNEERALVLNKRGYAERYLGFRSTSEEHRENSYKKAGTDWREVLIISSDIELQISAIKGLMLLPGEDLEALCRISKVAILNYSNNLTAEIMNLYGLVIRGTDTNEAMFIFEKGYGKAERGTIISGHLAQNIGICRLMQKNQEKDLRSKREYAISAMISLRVALEEYPENEIEHRRSVQGKIDNTQKEIENNFQ